jgi:hypothetical protein
VQQQSLDNPENVFHGMSRSNLDKFINEMQAAQDNLIVGVTELCNWYVEAHFAATELADRLRQRGTWGDEDMLPGSWLKRIGDYLELSKQRLAEVRRVQAEFEAVVKDRRKNL